MTAEPFASRWKRRARTIPLMLGITVVGVLTSPAIVAVAAIADLTKRRLRLPTVRVELFLLQYGINDSIEILLAPIYWRLADPGFDLIYNRTGSVFIPRDNGPEAQAMVRGLDRDVDSTTAVVIFPEAHTGLDHFGSFAELAKAVPLRQPINIRAWRTPVDEIPAGADERIAWLDEQWVLVNGQDLPDLCPVAGRPYRRHRCDSDTARCRHGQDRRVLGGRRVRCPPIRRRVRVRQLR